MTARNASRRKARQPRARQPKARQPGAREPGSRQPRARQPSGAKQRARRPANRLIFGVLVAAALAGLYAAAGLSRPVALTSARATGSAGQLSVSSALLGCLAPGSDGSTGGGIAVVNAPTSAGPGQVSLTRLNPAAGQSAGTTQNMSSQVGQLAVVSIKKAPVVKSNHATLPSMAGGLVPTRVGKGGLIIAASGAAAQGLDVEQLGPDGLPSASCQAPRSDFWFVSQAGPKLHTEVYLLNVDNSPASADVGIQTDSGPLLGKPDTGIVIPPHAMVVQSLDKLLGPARAVAVHISTSVGRIVAAMRQSSDLTKAGIWLPAAQPPATGQILTGMPASAGSRELYVTVPGNTAAQVKVTVVTPHGSYQPTGANGISILSHLAIGISIPSLGTIPGSLVVSANVPVTSVLEVPGGPAGAPGAFIGGSDPITEQGVVAASPVGSAGKTQLVLSAPGQAADVSIAVAAPGTSLSGLTGKTVHIPAKSAVQVPIKLPKGAKKGASSPSLVAIVVTPARGSGPVYAARLALVSGTVQTILPVVSSPTIIKLPAVRQSLLTVAG